MEKVDKYQERYLNHQKRKALSLTSDYGTNKFKKHTPKELVGFLNILFSRVSQRVFINEPLTVAESEMLLAGIDSAPSSCDRKGVAIKVVSERDKKDLLSGLLVGGVGWINRANIILLLFADMDCYKSPVEKDFMPYLDAGVMIQTTYLTCEAMNLGCCFTNPNIREENKEFFKKRFEVKDNMLFCGALAIGKYNKKHIH